MYGGLDVREHVFRHTRQVVLMLPAPVGACDGIVDASGPGIGVLLAHIRGVVDDEVGQVAADLGGEFTRVKLMAATL